MYSLSTLSSLYPRLKRRMKVLPTRSLAYWASWPSKLQISRKIYPEEDFNVQRLTQFALHGYCTSVHTSTGAIPLHPSVYNVKAVLLVEIKVPSTEVPIKDLKKCYRRMSWTVISKG
jgi:hypothetical protein